MRFSEELAHQLFDATTDIVADGPYGVDALASGVVELPVFVALSGEERAGVATTHGDHDVRGLHRLGGEDLGCSAVMSIPSSCIASTAVGLI